VEGGRTLEDMEGIAVPESVSLCWGHAVTPCIDADPWMHFTVATVRSSQLEFRSALIPMITGASACTLCPFDLEADDAGVCTMSTARSGKIGSKCRSM
jgi:hypothetical protein